MFDGKQNGAVEQAEELAAKLLRLCIAMGGSITGEYGVGVEKRDFLPEMFDASTMARMERLRLAFDPRLVANPRKMFPRTEAPTLNQNGLHPLEKAGVISRE